MHRTGATLLLTRPAVPARRFAAEFRARAPGVPVVLSPLIEIVPLDVDLPRAGGYIFTSESALVAFPEGGVSRIPAWCIGARTARAVAARGFATRVSEGGARALVALILAQRPQGPLVHLAGVHTAHDVAAELRAHGLDARSVTVYDQRDLPPTPEARELLAGTRPVLLPLFSARSASLAGGIPGISAPLHIVAMSAQVAAAWSGPPPASMQIAAEPSGRAMLRELALMAAAAGRA